MKRAEYLNEAKRIITKDRNQTYGEPENNFSTIADYWTIYLGIPVTAMDVGIMMNLFKTARIQSKPSIDSFVDSIGYMACAGEIFSNDELESLMTEEVEEINDQTK